MRKLSNIIFCSKIFNMGQLLFEYLIHNQHCICSVEIINLEQGLVSLFLLQHSSHLSFQRHITVQPLESAQQRFTSVWNLAWAENRKREGESNMCEAEGQSLRSHAGTNNSSTGKTTDGLVLVWLSYHERTRKSCLKCQQKPRNQTEMYTPLTELQKTQGTQWKIFTSSILIGQNSALIKDNTELNELKLIRWHAFCHFTASKQKGL